MDSVLERSLYRKSVYKVELYFKYSAACIKCIQSWLTLTIICFHLPNRMRGLSMWRFLGVTEKLFPTKRCLAQFNAHIFLRLAFAPAKPM